MYLKFIYSIIISVKTEHMIIRPAYATDKCLNTLLFFSLY